MLASDKLLNVAWTAPLLIVGGTYLQQKIGVLNCTKFFAMSILSTYLFMSAFGPRTELGSLNLRSMYKQMMPDWDCFDDVNHKMIGADGVAASVAYMILFYHRLWPVAGAFALFDISYYGLYGASAPCVAGLAALTLL